MSDPRAGGNDNRICACDRAPSTPLSHRECTVSTCSAWPARTALVDISIFRCMTHATDPARAAFPTLPRCIMQSFFYVELLKCTFLSLHTCHSSSSGEEPPVSFWIYRSPARRCVRQTRCVLDLVLRIMCPYINVAKCQKHCFNCSDLLLIHYLFYSFHQPSTYATCFVNPNRYHK